MIIESGLDAVRQFLDWDAGLRLPTIGALLLLRISDHPGHRFQLIPEGVSEQAGQRFKLMPDGISA